ncbi:MAG TPA: hypothetical protein VGM84_21810 [Steroidobacteraceae bacterium]|jgi:hypothetical protein
MEPDYVGCGVFVSIRRIIINWIARAVVGFAVGLVFQAVRAEEPAPEIRVEIAPQRLDEALKVFAAQAGIQVLFLADSPALRDRSSAISGQLSIPEVMDRLIAGSSLRYNYVNKRTIAIRDVGMVWTKNMLVIHNAKLGDLLTELRVFTAKRVCIVDQKASAVRVTGVYQGTNLSAFLAAIQISVPVVIAETDDAIVLRSAEVQEAGMSSDQIPDRTTGLGAHDHCSGS